MKLGQIVVLLLGLSSLAIAGDQVVPEIGPASGVAAFALISGALLVIRSRRKK